ncbi:MAG TPA: transcriptional regulator [Gammaproteobacteria bacterium]|jgi:DNA-binding transcriptional ArsR family regulator|nr:helix-turn-helix transcriptional regulator [Gammaproteobacteria bacterium]MDP6733253.1 helix-turn-helix transcriptional regulator [Gammaproteobacteria bacterium]HAJ75791.1 transcriptional regulator [Gammaproteobacteria bacterium]|tara:strand:+ start:1677 stop:2024 length:348 start_codon:yes stop_codon:yes gene_type:complete
MVKRPLQNAEDEQHELVIKAIASADRRLILDLLRDEPQTTGKICQELPWLNRCTVMQHLGVLEKARLVISKKQGRQRWNYLDVSPIQRFHERWIKAYSLPSASLLSKLQKDLEAC